MITQRQSDDLEPVGPPLPTNIQIERRTINSFPSSETRNDQSNAPRLNDNLGGLANVRPSQTSSRLGDQWTYLPSSRAVFATNPISPIQAIRL